MPKCLLHGYGACRGKLSREHFLSENVLLQLSRGRSATIGGLPWQPPSTLQDIGIGALQSRILCEGHNNGLTELDQVAGNFFRTLDAIDKHPESVASNVQFHGPIVERWFLKVVCGLVAGQGLAGGGVPEEWKMCLTGQSWPDGWGLYSYDPGSPQIFSKSTHIEFITHAKTGRVLATHFFYAGASFFLLIGKPDHSGSFGIHRPRGLIFKLPDMVRHIEFIWPFHTEQAMIYTKIGTTSEEPQYVQNWNRA